MTPPSTLIETPAPAVLPDHTQLPCTDGLPVNNFQEHPQSNLLTSSILPRLREIYPDGQFCIGEDCGIYWRHAREPLDGCKAPDWFLVPGVPPMLDGQLRRSYVLWQEVLRPLIVIEYVSGNGSEERDTTPFRGKWWVYEQAIAATYYAIYEVERSTVELYHLAGGRYRPVTATVAGRLPVTELGVELGIWPGIYRGMDLPWLRVWDASTAQLLPSEEERAEAERQRAESERQRAEAERQRAEAERQRAIRLAEKLRSLGIDPDTV
jgi:Uma2 family endonuclease